jgi:hypothetical protein
LVEVQLPRRAIIVAVLTALVTFIAATAITSESASAAEIPPSPSADWKFCSAEGSICHGRATGLNKDLPYSTTQIRYGDYDIPGCGGCFGRWTIQTRTGDDIPCTNAVFGDPFANRAKHCEYDASDWVYCAPENGTCDTGTTTRGYWVRYGASDPHAPGTNAPEVGWTVKKITGTTSCTNSAFGVDPHYGVVKGCWFYTGTIYTG